MKSIYLSDPGAAKRRCPSPVPQTCAWIFEKREFSDWLSDRGLNVLWISGRAGSGKTVLSSFLIDALHEFVPTVCFFFSDEKIISQNTASSLLRGILHQLLEANHHLIIHSLRFFETRGNAILEEISSLWNIIRSCFDDPDLGNIVFILDALDECEPSERNQVLRWMMEYFVSSRKKNIKIVLTSRPDIGIQDILDSRSYQLGLESFDTTAEIENDIVRVIKYEINHMPALKTWPENQKKQLQARLIANADKTFLWVSLVLHMLPYQADASKDGFYRLLTQMPDGLDNVYSKMLEAIRVSDRHAAKKMLEILVVMRDPPSLRQLNECWAIRHFHHRLSDFQIQPDMTRTISRLCGNFVHIVDDRCYFVHQSAKEYLLRRPKINRNSWFSLTLPEANLSLAERCLSVLNLDDFNASNLLSYNDLQSKSVVDEYMIPQPRLLRTRLKNHSENMPFLRYAIHHWAFHFRESSINNVFLQDMFSKSSRRPRVDIFQFYCKNISLRAYWFAKMLRLTDVPHQSIESAYSVPPSVFCAYNGHVSVLASLLDLNARIAILDFTALHAAVLGKQLDTIRLLLKRGADVNVIDTWGRTPLHLAARRADVDILGLLLSSGADPKIKDHFGITPLQDAEECGFKTHLDLLSHYHSDQSSISEPEAYFGREPDHSNSASPLAIWEKRRNKQLDKRANYFSALDNDSDNSIEKKNPRLIRAFRPAGIALVKNQNTQLNKRAQSRRSPSAPDSDSDDSSEKRSASIASRSSSRRVSCSRTSKEFQKPRTASLPDASYLKNKEHTKPAISRRFSLHEPSTKTK